MRAVVAVGVFLASLLVPPIASAETACEGGAFAVGGYPKTGRVPDGYQAVDTPGGIFPWEGRGGYNHGQQVGAANMIEAVDTYAAQCPDAEIRLHGYSYGAAIVHTAVETIDQRDYAPRVHVELAGNPRRPGGVEDTWSWVALPGIAFRGAGITPQHVASFEDRCNVGRDYVCSAPHPIDIVGSVSGSIGYGTGGHSYP